MKFWGLPVSVFLLALGLLSGAPSAALADDSASSGNKVEVVEFFWYGCPHCYRFQTHLEDWEEDGMPDNVEFRQVPAILSQDWVVHGRAFYAAQLMDVLDQFHQPFYDAIHQDKRNLNSVDSIAAFAGELGIDAEEFADTMESFAVENRLREARNLNQEYGVRGTPTMGVAGDKSVSPSEAGSYEAMLSMVNEYVAEARGE